MAFKFAPPVKIVFSGNHSACQEHIKFAVNQLAILERQMSFQSLNEGVRRVSPFNGVFVECVSSFSKHEVRIHVQPTMMMSHQESVAGEEISISEIIEELFPHILFIDFKAAGYNYLEDRWERAAYTPAQGKLVQGYNGRCQVDDLTHSTYLGGWTTGTIAENGIYIGGLNAFELAFFNSSGSIYVRQDWVKKPLGSLNDPTLPFAMAYGELFGISVYQPGETWNQYRGALLQVFDPVAGTTRQSWKWVPSLFTAGPMGWFYGKYTDFPAPEYGWHTVGNDLLYSSLDRLEVELMGIVDCKSTEPGTDAGLKYGWCEYVTRVEYFVGDTRMIEDVSDLYFYFSNSPLSESNTGTYFSAREENTTAHLFITIGASLSGFSPAIKMKNLPYTVKSVDLWAFSSWRNAGIENQKHNAIGIVVVSNEMEVTVFRYKEYQLEVFTGPDYHSHSVSRDGKILAIFFGDNLITSVKVFDLFGRKDGDGPVDSDGYNGGGFVELQSSDSIAVLEAKQAVIIPHRLDEVTPTPHLDDIFFDETDYNKFASSLATMSFYKDGAGPVYFHKLRCSDGIHAVFQTGVDECFESRVVISDPDTVIENREEQKVGEWNFGGVIKGLVRGDFVGTGDNTRFYGIGPEWQVATLPPVVFMAWQIGGGVYIRDAVGSIIYGSGFDPDGTVNQSLADIVCDPDGDGYGYTVTTSCGQEGFLLELVGPLEISGSSAPADTEQYAISGGIAPYSVSVTGGASITNDGLLTGVRGNCGRGVITVVDSCGRTVTLSFMYPNGQWVAVAFNPCISPLQGRPYDYLQNIIGNPTHYYQESMGWKVTYISQSSARANNDPCGYPAPACDSFRVYPECPNENLISDKFDGCNLPPASLADYWVENTYQGNPTYYYQTQRSAVCWTDNSELYTMDRVTCYPMINVCVHTVHTSSQKVISVKEWQCI